MNIAIISLGCDKNRVDSEKMLGLLKGSGFSFTNDESEADIIIVNTCCFIDEAKSESIDTILEMAEYKEYGNCRYLFVAGCLSERYRDELLEELPEVDGYIGTSDLSQIADLIREKLCEDDMLADDESIVIHESRESFASDPGPEKTGGNGENRSKITDESPSEQMIRADRVITTPGHYEFLKIAEGCSKRCTYCIIPYVRGSYRSFPMEDLLAEARFLAEQGVTELIIVAQETSIYGRDLYGRDMLPELLERLCLIDELRWIRLLYCYPEDITEQLLDVMAREEKICKYLDMPVQHASDRILKMMGRRTNKAQLLEKIALVRAKIPGVVLRTSLITGFPGETAEDHKELLEFVRTVRFDRLGVFTYSQEEGTPAAGFPGQIEEEIKNSRRDDIMTLQNLISYENLTSHIDETFDVVVDGYLPDDDVYAGRTYMDAPDVDGAFFFRSERSLMTGEHVTCIAINASDYDLYGELV